LPRRLRAPRNDGNNHMIFIYVPCQNLDTAKLIAKILVEKRMAGKVDIMYGNHFVVSPEP